MGANMYKIIVIHNDGHVIETLLPKSTTVYQAHELLEPLRKQAINGEIKSVEFWLGNIRVSAVIAGMKGGD
jgi:hypothetical protein